MRVFREYVETLTSKQHLSRVVQYTLHSCGKEYTGETTRRLEQRVKEHQDACKRGDEKVSAIAEYAWQQHHPIKWKEVRVVDRASKNHELKIRK